MTEAERHRLLTAARDTVLAAFPDTWAIYVYGSFARGDEWPDSEETRGILEDFDRSGVGYGQ